MTREEYVSRLSALLDNYDEEYKRDILEAINEHFDEGAAMGISEQQIVDELGDPAEIVGGEEKATEHEAKRESGGEEEELSSLVNRLVNRVMGTVRGALDNVRVSVNYMDDDTPMIRYEDTSELSEVAVQGGALDVKVEGVDSEELSYSFKNEGNTELKIDSFGGRLNFGPAVPGRSLRGTLRLALPRNVDTLLVNLSSGDSEVEDISLKRLSINCTSGDIKLRDLVCEEVRSATASGDVDGEEVTLGMLKCRSGSGDIDIRGRVAKAECSSASGDIEFEGELVSANIKSASGDVEISSTTGEENYRIETVSGDVRLGLAGSPTVYFRSISGDMSNRSRFTVSGVSLGADIVVETVSGDLEI